MKKNILAVVIALLASIAATAQSTNPLNYSGRMYIEAYEIFTTPRYIYFEDHAILSQQSRIPSVEISRCEMDFEKGIVKINDSPAKPYFLQITKTDDCVKSARMVLSSKPFDSYEIYCKFAVKFEK